MIGLYDETGEVVAEHVKANDPHEAMAQVAVDYNAPSQILCAIEGEHQAVCACEDAGKAVYIEDLKR